MAEQFRIDLWWGPTKKNDSYALSAHRMNFIHIQRKQGEGGRGAFALSSFGFTVVPDVVMSWGLIAWHVTPDSVHVFL